MAHAHRKRLAIAQDDTASSFPELLEVLNGMVAELEDVMASDRFVASVLPFRDMQVRADEFFNTTVEAVDMRIAPFELHELSEATWQQMAHHKHEDTQIIHTDVSLCMLKLCGGGTHSICLDVSSTSPWATISTHETSS